MSKTNQKSVILSEYDQKYAGLLEKRAPTFRKAFELLLDKEQQQYLIVETGTCRFADNWSGDGQSTRLFDWFINQTGGQVFSVDIDPNAVQLTRSNVSEKTKVYQGDSVDFLWYKQFDRPIDMCYLDSYDIDPNHPHPSALHHLKELTAVISKLADQSLILVDDNFNPTSGKGIYVAEFFRGIGASLIIQEYQELWYLDKRQNKPDSFLDQVSGVIHVGANTGQERDLYANHDLDVLWIESIPEIFAKLNSNIAGFPKQIAQEGLITDQDNKQYQFHIANNEANSSSIFDLNLHREIWPDICYENTIPLQSTTLPSLLQQENINLDKYDALVMDTQGSELLVLKGAETILNRFKYIKTEVADFESYSGCSQLPEIQEFLEEHGFIEHSRHQFASCPSVGSYYDIIYRKT